MYIPSLIDSRIVKDPRWLEYQRQSVSVYLPRLLGLIVLMMVVYVGGFVFFSKVGWQLPKGFWGEVLSMLPVVPVTGYAIAWVLRERFLAERLLTELERSEG